MGSREDAEEGEGKGEERWENGWDSRELTQTEQLLMPDRQCIRFVPLSHLILPQLRDLGTIIILSLQAGKQHLGDFNNLPRITKAVSCC